MDREFSGQIFEEYSDTKFYKNPSRESRDFFMRTDTKFCERRAKNF